MKKRFEILSLLAAATLFALLAFSSLARAQSGQDTAPQSQTQQPDTQPSQTPPADTQAPPPRSTAPQAGQQTSDPQMSGNTQEFVGMVLKQGDKYVIRDEATGNTYDIDHQDDVKKFEGKKVRVHGTLDPSTKTIHVQ